MTVNPLESWNTSVLMPTDLHVVLSIPLRNQSCLFTLSGALNETCYYVFHWGNEKVRSHYLIAKTTLLNTWIYWEIWWISEEVGVSMVRRPVNLPCTGSSMLSAMKNIFKC
jgi:hypothetical protein